jgi:hypothetical protein
MKKLTNLIILLILLGFPLIVNAAGSVTISNTSLNIKKGDSASFTVNCNNCAGRIDLSSVNSGIATVSPSNTWLDNSSATITIYGVSVGSTYIKVNNTDVTTYDDENISGKSYTINVTVYEPTTASPSTNNNYVPPVTAKPDTRSKNTNIASLKIDGYDLVKVDNNNYTLEVQNNVTSINISATLEDSKSAITGTGKHDLNIGKNDIELIITSESGTTNKILISVTRKDGYYLTDLDNALKDNTLKEINIIINADSKLTQTDLTKIKESKKEVNLNYYDQNKKLIYSWTIDGSKLTDFKEIDTLILFNSNNQQEISKLSNYAEGLNINFKHNGSLPANTKIKLYVGDKFKNNDLVNVYYFNNISKKLELISKELKVTDLYIEFNINHASEYFVTMSNINNVKVNTSSKLNIALILLIIENIIFGTLLIIYLLKRTKTKKNMI